MIFLYIFKEFSQYIVHLKKPILEIFYIKNYSYDIPSNRSRLATIRQQAALNSICSRFHLKPRL